jgi:hypothetical protein
MNPKESILFALVLILGTLTLGSVAFGWTPPGFAPPSGNVAAPLNAGVTSQTKSGNLTVAQLTSSASSGTAPLVVTSQTKVANLNADLLDGLDASGFGDATLANQTTLIAKVGTSTDGAGTGTLFAHAARLYAQVDNSYSASVTMTGVGSAPACPSGWTDITGQLSGGTFQAVTSVNNTGISPLTSCSFSLDDNDGYRYHTSRGSCSATSYSLVSGVNLTTYTFYYRVCGLPR